MKPDGNNGRWIAARKGWDLRSRILEGIAFLPRNLGKLSDGVAAL